MQGMTITTPKERGFILPIGQFDGRGFQRNFSLRGLGFEIERSIAKWRRLNPMAPNTAMVGKILSLLISSIGGEKWERYDDDDKATEAKRVVELGKLYLADIYYMYVMARLEELGAEYEINYMCNGPECDFAGKMQADIETMDVHCVDDPAALQKQIKLSRGLKYRDGTIKKSVTTTPMLWMNMIDDRIIESSGDSQAMKLYFIEHCITGVEGVDDAVMLLPDELNSLRKLDIEILGRDIHNTNVGPTMIAKGECPKCKDSFEWPIDWDYESFFTISSP